MRFAKRFEIAPKKKKVRIFTRSLVSGAAPRTGAGVAPVAAARSGYHGGGEEGSGHGGLAETSPAAPPRQPELRCVPLISYGGAAPNPLRPTCFAGWLTMSTWRNVGITYLKYADICATHVRNALKEPAKTKAKSSSNMHARITQWEAGKRGEPRELRLPPLRIALPSLP